MFITKIYPVASNDRAEVFVSKVQVSNLVTTDIRWSKGHQTGARRKLEWKRKLPNMEPSLVQIQILHKISVAQVTVVQCRRAKTECRLGMFEILLMAAFAGHWAVEKVLSLQINRKAGCKRGIQRCLTSSSSVLSKQFCFFLFYNQIVKSMKWFWNLFHMRKLKEYLET